MTSDFIITRKSDFDDCFLNDIKYHSFYENNNCGKSSFIKNIMKYYNTNGLFRNIINIPARDATRKNIVIKNKYKQQILEELNKRKYRTHLEKAVRIARLFGSALILLDIKTNTKIQENDLIEKEEVQTLEKITEDDTIKNFSISHIFNPSEFYIVQDDNALYPLDWDYYMITSPKSSIKVHKSRAILITHQELQERADRLCEGSMFLHLYNDISRYEDALEIQANLMIMSQYDIIQMDLNSQFTGDEDSDKAKIKEMMDLLKKNIMAKTTQGTFLADKEDKISRIQSIFTGYADVTNSFKDKIVAGSGIPKMILFNDTLSGLSNESNTTLSNYYAHIETLQEDCLRNACAYLIKLICKMNNFDITNYDDFEFATLWQQDDEEKSKTMLNYINAVSKAKSEDVLTTEEARNILKNNNILQEEIQTDNKKKDNEFDLY